MRTIFVLLIALIPAVAQGQPPCSCDQSLRLELESLRLKLMAVEARMQNTRARVEYIPLQPIIEYPPLAVVPLLGRSGGLVPVVPPAVVFSRERVTMRPGPVYRPIRSSTICVSGY